MEGSRAGVGNTYRKNCKEKKIDKTDLESPRHTILGWKPMKSSCCFSFLSCHDSHIFLSQKTQRQLIQHAKAFPCPLNTLV